MDYVILGNGIAGVSAAETIRQLDPEGGITIVADETFTPYSRPMIAMVLAGEVSSDKLPIRKGSFYDDLRISAVLGNRVSGIDVDQKRVMIQNDAYLPFDKLLIATGADPRPIKAEGLSLNNIFFMRTEAHIRDMLAAISEAKKALVLGGGLVGFKAAYGLLKKGLDVTMLITSGYPLSLQVDETTGKLILDELRNYGLKVRVGISVEAFEGNGAVAGARLSDGSHATCDMVVVGKGVLPALSFVPRDKIDVDLGILVSEQMETSAAGIFAAGDVAECVDVSRQTRWVNAIWPEAVTQGRIAGSNMAGRPVSYRGSLSRNVLRILSLDVMTMGMVNAPDTSEYEVIASLNPGSRTYRKLVFRENTLCGAVMLNAIEQGGILMGLIQNEIPINVPKKVLLQPTFNFKQLMI
ncbi:MAG: FAD-dependent oxidoreductase [Desulfobacterales bacterium]|nr:FAD-dependent oxidoreductase [Desulfobacterales bacterium]